MMDYEFSQRLKNPETVREYLRKIGAASGKCAECGRPLLPGVESWLITMRRDNRIVGRILCGECYEKVKPHAGT